ncbi:T9SS type A sorting domain-containing protein [Kordia sp.]|uniref:T9SS type A sorting domain-containing protein n=1 Tax=Kordia sp. TaxID=1965332 RepID=UPI0025C03D94|nr:T9SS type A sorting domain-containing protein [Kordia sp.]MCH2196460.1 T9SS type A sorting domain-containing protein [Kordia sp.]
MTAQNPDVIGTWYIINVINDFQPITYTQPPITTEVASIKFLDTTDAVNAIGFSGCNNFQVEADVSADTMFGYGDIFLSNFSSEMNYCSDAYDNWEGRFYWILDNYNQYYLSSSNGVDYLSIENPIFSGIYMQNQPLSVTQNSLTKIHMYPNPVTDVLFITNTALQIKSFVIYNTQGQKIKEINNHNNSLDVSTLSKGLYFLDILTSTGKFTEKFMKK